MTLLISSTAFEADGKIAQQYTGDGQDLSPPLRWEGVPAGTQELALICEDPDAPTATPWVHWVLYRLAPTVTELPEGLSAASRLEQPVAAFQGRNSWSTGRTIGYRGPAPPPRHGLHHYHFRLYALDHETKLQPGVDKAALMYALRDHILEQAEIVGTYERK